MAIFYSDAKGEGGQPSVPYHRWNAVKGYLNHYSNYLMLSFIAQSTRDRAEKHQAVKELAICERKMRFWTTHPNYDQSEVTKGCAALKRDWAI